MLSRNPGLDLPTADLFDDAVLNELAWGDAEPTALVPGLQALQRLCRVASSIDAGKALYAAGFRAAAHIAALPRERFVAEHGDAFGPAKDPAGEARRVHRRSVAIRSRAVLAFTSLEQHTAAHYRATRFDNLSRATDEKLGTLPSYEDLFGQQSFCSCEDCRTVLSPAAYFLDLLRLVEGYLTFDDKALLLQDRRTDLIDTLVLDCAGTYTLTPKIRIVNDVLLSVLKPMGFEDLAALTYPFELPFDLPLAEIRRYLARAGRDLPGIWRALSPAPADDVQHAIDRETLGLSPAQWALYGTAAATNKDIIAAYGLPDKTTDPAATLAKLETFLTQTGLSEAGLVELLEEDLNAAELAPDKKLRDPFFINATGEGKAPIGLKGGALTNLTLARLDHVHRFIRLSRALGWSFTELDWALRAINAVLDVGKPAPASPTLVLDDTVLPYLAWIARARSTRSVTVIQCCAILGTLKDVGSKDAPPLFDAIFNGPTVPNPPAWKAKDGAYDLRWVVPALGDPGEPAERDRRIQSALAAALRLRHDELIRLTWALPVPDDVAPRTLILSLPTLARLYRLSMIGKLVGLSAGDWLALLGLPGQPDHVVIRLAGADPLPILRSLEETAAWLKASGLTVDPLQFGLTGTSANPLRANQALSDDQVANFLDGFRTSFASATMGAEAFDAATAGPLQSAGATPGKMAKAVYGELQKEGYLVQDPTKKYPYLKQVPTPEQMRGVVAACCASGAAASNPHVVSLAEGLLAALPQKDEELAEQAFDAAVAPSIIYGLCAAFLDAGVVTRAPTGDEILTEVVALVPAVFDGAAKRWKAVAARIAMTLQQAHDHQQQVFGDAVASLCGISPQLVPTLASWIGLSLVDLVAQPAPDHVAGDLRMFLPRSQLLQALSLSPAQAAAVAQHPAYFGVSWATSEGSQACTMVLDDVRALTTYRGLVRRLGDGPNHLLAYFGEVAGGSDVKAAATKLCAITRWNEAEATFLIEALWPPGTSSEFSQLPWGTVAGVALLADWFDAAADLGVTARSLWDLVALARDGGDYAGRASLADTLLGGLQGNAQGNTPAVQNMLAQLEEAKRDALVPLAISTLRANGVRTARDLYERLLIDVEVSSAVTTSPVKEGLSALQLYIYRCLNGLEPGVTITADNMQELERQWAWMSQYRVWQANREVFLFPENYIEPELRSRTSPEFTQLVQDLQQTNLTEQTADVAIRDYLNGFTTVATLEVVGSYVYETEDPDQPAHPQRNVILLGRTATQAYQYYYRTGRFRYVDGLSQGRWVPTGWDPWTAIDLQINNAVATPVFAFNRLFLFWVEIKQGAAERDPKTGKATGNTHESTGYFSFHDFTGKWAAPQVLFGPVAIKASSKGDGPPAVDAPPAPIFDLQRVKAIYGNDGIYWAYAVGSSSHQHGSLNERLGPADIQLFSVGDDGAHGAHSWIYALDGDSWLPPQQDVIPILSNVSTWGNLLAGTPGGDSQDIHIYEKQGGSWTDIGKVTGAYCTALSGDWLMATGHDRGSVLVYRRTNGGWKFTQEFGPLKKGAVVCVALWGRWAMIGWDAFGNLPMRLDVFCCSGDVWAIDDTILAGPYSALQVAIYERNALISCAEAGESTSEVYTANLGLGDKWNIDTKILIRSSTRAIDLTMSESTGFFLGGDGFVYSCIRNEDGISYSLAEDIKPLRVWSWTIAANGCRLSDQSAWQYLGLADFGITIPEDAIPGTSFDWQIVDGPYHSQFLTGTGVARPIRLTSYVAHDIGGILFGEGIDGLYALATQELPEINLDGTTTKTLDFSASNGLYYWELFFPIPFLIARSLSSQGQYEQAMAWYKRIFDPTAGTEPSARPNGAAPAADAYWQFIQLKSANNPVLAGELNRSYAGEVIWDVGFDPAQLEAYHDDPFDPHAIAALRPIAYQKAVVMHFIDNLLAWGDSLFRQYTIETIVEATMLYVMAYDLLGEQPVSLGPCELPPAMTTKDIAASFGGKLEDLPELLIILENRLAGGLSASDNPNNYIPNSYFSLPENAQFMAYWDTVRSRLYNIRHGLNIDGVPERLALFQPPINPMDLVAGVAAGEGLAGKGSAGLSDVPPYRFAIMAAKAKEVAGTAIGLGQALLAALEKGDGEALALLYNRYQQDLLALRRSSGQDELSAASQNIAALEASLQGARDRAGHYQMLLQGGLSAAEISQIALESAAAAVQYTAQSLKGASIAGYLVPTIYGFSDGGMHPGDAILQGANVLEGTANAMSMAAGLAVTMAGYQRRAQDWDLLHQLALDDLNEIQIRIAAAQYQERVAQAAITQLEKEVAQQQAVEHYMLDKFSSQKLYQWLSGKLAATYSQAFQLAYRYALQAQTAWEFERGIAPQTFIQAGHWDTLHRGLGAGEGLLLDLQRMEQTYLRADERRLEIQRVIFLSQIDPAALLNLKTEGKCSFDLDERTFDWDYPGHYCRQIKRISISFPALLGPYQRINATLTQTGNWVLMQPDQNGVAYMLTRPGAPNGMRGANADELPASVRVDQRAAQQVALTRGLDDSGMFVVDFNDPRYLPFEGTGAVSSWTLDMPLANNPIDLGTLTDVIITLDYTALYGGDAFGQFVASSIKPFQGCRPLSMANEYGTGWYRFVHDGDAMAIEVSPALFRKNFSGVNIESLTVFVRLSPDWEGPAPDMTLAIPAASARPLKFKLDDNQRLACCSLDPFDVAVNAKQTWSIALDKKDASSNPGSLQDMVLLLNYTAATPD